MSFLKICGALALLAFALLASECYRKDRESAFLRLEGMVLLLRFLKEEIDRYLTPCDEIFLKFRHEALEACGFLPLLREKKSLAEALELSYEDLALPEKIRSELTDYAGHLGQGYREEEVERANCTLARVLPIYETARETLKKNIRLARVLLLSGAVMLILWLL